MRPSPRPRPSKQRYELAEENANAEAEEKRNCAKWYQNIKLTDEFCTKVKSTKLWEKLKSKITVSSGRELLIKTVLTQ